MTSTQVSSSPRRIVPAVIAAAILALGVTTPLHQAEARGSVHVGIGIGVPVYGPGYYGYGYGYPAPYYPYYPEPVYYAPPVAYAPAPAQSYAAPASYSTQYCQQYQSSQMIDGHPQPVTGTACRQPDGSWRIVQ